MRILGGRNGLVCLDMYKIYMLVMVIIFVNVNMESWILMIDRRDGLGYVRIDYFLILMCINIIFWFYFL